MKTVVRLLVFRLEQEFACLSVCSTYLPRISWLEDQPIYNKNNNVYFLLLLLLRPRHRRLNRNIIIVINTYKCVSTRRMKKTDSRQVYY